MTFQQHTTYEQSLRLKELGLVQDRPGKRDAYWLHPEPARNAEDIADTARTITRQEIEDILMEHYDVRVEQAVDTPPPFAHVYLGEYGRGITKYQDFMCDGRDPFQALYDALVWHLTQKKA